MKNTSISILCMILALFALVLVIYARIGQPAPVPEPTPTYSDPGTATVPAYAPEAPAAPELTPEPSPEPEPEYYTISVIGDCTLTTFNGGSDYKNKMNGDYAYPFSGTVDYFREDDLTIGNLECTLSDKALYSGRTFSFLCPTDYVNILTEGCVDFVTTANNHFDDFGQTGVDDTYAALDAAGFPYGKENECCIYTTPSGLVCGIYCAFNYFATSKAQVTDAVAQLKAAGAEYIICAMHWGMEGQYDVVQESQIDVAHAAIDAGADLIYGSHPHVLQHMEEYGDGLILYSMGNWTFGGNTNPRDRDTAIIQVIVERAPDGSLSNYDTVIIPCCLSSTEGCNDYRPVPYEEGCDEYYRTLSKLDGSFDGENLSIDYSAFH